MNQTPARQPGIAALASGLAAVVRDALRVSLSLFKVMAPIIVAVKILKRELNVDRDTVIGDAAAPGNAVTGAPRTALVAT